MSPRKRKCILALAILSALLAQSAPSSAEGPSAGPPSETNKAEASSHFGKGVVFYKDGDFRAALVEFRRANQLAPSNTVLYNIARCYAELRENTKAMTTFERYLANATAELDDVKRKAVVDEMHKLEQRVARVDAHVTVEGADVSVDGEVVGTSPLPRAVVIDVGSHAVSASKIGYLPQTKQIDVAAGDHIVLDFELRVAASPVAASTPGIGTEASPHPAKRSGPSTGAWIAGASTVVLAVTGATFGVLAIGAHGDLSTATNALPGNAATIASDHQRMQLFSAVADTAGALAVGTGVVTLVLLFAHNGSGNGGDGRAGIGWDFGPLGASVSGRF